MAAKTPTSADASAQPRTSKSKSRASGVSFVNHGNDEFDVWLRSRQLKKPENQLSLPEADLTVELRKMLTAQNRHVPQNLVVFSFKECGFVPVEKPRVVSHVFQTQGALMRLDSDEAKAQIALKEGEWSRLLREVPSKLSRQKCKMAHAQRLRRRKATSIFATERR